MIKFKTNIREYDIVLNDREIEEILGVLKKHDGPLPEHAERFIDELENR